MRGISQRRVPFQTFCEQPMNRPLFVLLALLLSATSICAESTNLVRLLTLDEAQTIALRQHPQLAAAQYRALAAEQVAKQARAGYFPQANLYLNAVGANSEDTRILAGGLNNPSVMDRVAGGLGVTQLITDFGRTANLSASSKLSAQAEHQRMAMTREQVLLDVDANYFGALQAQAVLLVAQQTMDTRQLLLDQVTLLASNKLKSELDVSFARVALEEGRLLLERAQNDRDATFAALSSALGYQEFQSFQLADAEPTARSRTNGVYQLIELALQKRPELLTLRNEEQSALRFASAQRDSRLPTVSATGVVGGSPIHDDRLPDYYAAGGIQLSLPLFGGGMYVARQHEAELRAEAAREQLRAAQDNVVRDVRVAWLSLGNAREKLRTTAQLLVQATQAFDLAQARYKVGSSSIVELSQAQLELTSAQIAAANARYAVLLQEVNLDYQVGVL